MSVTGLNLRGRLRQQVVVLIDALVARLDVPEPAASPDAVPAATGAPRPVPSAAPTAAPEPAPTPAPAPTAAPEAAPARKLTAAAPPPKLRPLPEVGARPAPARAPRPTRAPAEPAVPAEALHVETPAGAAAKASPEDRQKQHWERTRRGLLRFVADQGGRAGLRELHDHSERTYFVAHVGFSRMMEELTGEGLLDYDQDTAVATLTDAGRTTAGAA